MELIGQFAHLRSAMSAHSEGRFVSKERDDDDDDGKLFPCFVVSCGSGNAIMQVSAFVYSWLLKRSVCVCVCALSNLTNYNSAVLPSMMILNLAAFLHLSHNSADNKYLCC